MSTKLISATEYGRNGILAGVRSPRLTYIVDDLVPDAGVCLMSAL